MIVAGIRYKNAIMWMVLFLIGGILYLIFGKNKREKKGVPVGMSLLAVSPVYRYAMYGAGVILLLFGALIVVLMSLSGEVELFPIIFMAVLILCVAGIFFLAGYAFYARHIFFNEEKIMIGKLFDEPDVLPWKEISRAELKKNRIRLYDKNGKRCLDVSAGMIGFREFQTMAEQKCAHL